MIHVEKPISKNYIVLEGFFWEEKEFKNWYILHLDKGENMIQFGRANYSDVRMSCISVSRDHANLKLSDQGKFYIEDLNSKFGTLILMTNNISLIPHYKLSLQYNNSFFSFLVKSRFLSCCVKKLKLEYSYYNQYLNNIKCHIDLERYKIKEVKTHLDFKAIKGYSNKLSKVSEILIESKSKRNLHSEFVSPLFKHKTSTNIAKIININNENDDNINNPIVIIEEENKDDYNLNASESKTLFKKESNEIIDFIIERNKENEILEYINNAVK